MCNECNCPLGSNDRCRNCADYQNYYAGDYFSDRDGEAWEELFDRLRDDDPDR